MARCGDCGNRCSCTVKAGANIKVTGAGTLRNPYVIEGEGAGGGGGWTPGDIKMAGYVVPEAGWLVANGQAVSRTTYAALYAKIGTTFGAGDGANTFQLPDLADRMPMGAGITYDLGEQGGAAEYVLTMANVPAHTHTIAHSHDFSHGHTASASATNTDHLHYWASGYSGGHSHVYHMATSTRGFSTGGASGFSWETGNFGTGGDGGHSHEGWTGAMNQNASHGHTITVNNFNGSTGGSSAANSGSTGQAAPTAVPTLPPFVGVTFLIKT